MRKLVLALGALSLALPVTAQAHFNLTMPPSTAKSTEGGKGDAPCGPDTTAKEATATITPVTGGSMLTIHIDETTPHPGFYRFALSTTSPPSFPADNVVKDKDGNVLLPTSGAQSSSADFEDPAKFPVLADHMFSHGDVGQQSFPSAAYPGQVMLPNINCEKCTLQVIEFMASHYTNGPSAGFFYHHCALLKITADPNKPIFDPNASGGAGGTSGAGGASGSAGSAGSSGAATGGTGGGGSGGTSGSVGVSGGGASAAGAPAAAGASSAGAPSAAGAAGIPVTSGSNSDDGGGCSLGHRSSSSAPILALLVGLLALGRRRRVRG